MNAESCDSLARTILVELATLTALAAFITTLFVWILAL
jgi:hypothetical protein